MARLPVPALLAATLFLLAGAERAFSYAACPHHGLPAGPGDPAHAAHHEGRAPADHSSPCSCLGQCQAGSALNGVPAAAPAIAMPVTLVTASGLVEPAPRPRHTPHALPFATAPPRDR